MASTSSSSIVLSPSPKYDVFLSFRGEDTRDSFTDHLYEALIRTGLHIFRDNDEIPRGEELGPEIEAAIKASKASIIVLSKNYATSSWCLRELSLILERRRKFQHFVLPVFYHVDPSHVKKHKESFMIEVETSSLTWTDDNVKRWKEALTEVAELTGLVLSGSEARFVDKIIAEIYHKVYSKTIILPCYLTGMNARDEYIKLWLGNPDIKVLAICGMGGSGKTTLARYILSSNWQQFNKSCLVEDMGCQNQNDSNELFTKFADDLLGKGTVSYTKETVYRFLQTKRALIVFDDVEEPSMLEHYLGHLDIHKQSKIIITTRKSNTHDWFKHRSWRCQEYKMQLLDVDESLELLSLHAFGSKIPREGYNELAKEALQYCEGNPLALEVLGSFLAKNINIPFWRSKLDLLKIDFNLKLQNVLIRSYDALPDEKNKGLFLHIACFFIGEDKDYVQNILEKAYCALAGIEELTGRCLLSVSNNKLMMHRLIQEMGRNIIRQQSNIPIERTIVWLSKESYKIMRKGKGSEKIKGLALDMQMLDTQMVFVHRQESESLKTDSLRNMDYLELLQLNNVHLTGSYESFSEELLWLCWRGFGLEAIPWGLFQQNLVAIDMKDSKLKIFQSPIVLVSLKTLNLQGSSSLSEIRYMSRLPNLETLILCDCKKLLYCCESIGGLMNLAILNMNGCEGLRNFLQLPRSLVWLSLRNCNVSANIPLTFKLKYLDLGRNWFESLPRYNHLENLRVLDLTLCRLFGQLLCLPRALEELYVDFCRDLEKITFESHQFTLKEFGYQGCSKLSEVEGFFKLELVAMINDLGHLKWLKVYEDLKVRLVAVDDFTYDGNFLGMMRLKMLYEFGIMSISLPDIKEDPNTISEHLSESPSVTFSVPPDPRRLKGLNVTFKYTISDKEWVWFIKISTFNHTVDYMYNPFVFGDPGDGNVGIWLSYWPIGSALLVGDQVTVSIVVMSGLEIRECGATLVYEDDGEEDGILNTNPQWVETIGGDLSGFKLSTGAYYLCRRDFFHLMEVGRLTPGWLSTLVGYVIDDTEVRGWRKTGRPAGRSFELSNPIFTELKTF